MNKRLKVLASALTVLLVSTALVGCGKKADDSNKAAETKGGKNLVVWSHLTETEVKEVDKIAQDWAKKTGNTVKVVADKGDMQAYLQAANSSKGPDIMYGIANDNLGTFQKAKLLAEVPEGTIDKSKYVPLTLDAVSYDKKLYGVPVSMETYALFYNTDKVKTAPATYDDLIAQAQKVGFKYDVNNFYFSYAVLAGNGAYVFKNNGGALDPSDIGLGNDGAKKGYQALQDLVQKYKFMPADIKGDIAKGEFQSGKTGLYISGPWDVDGFKKANTKFAVATLPTIDGKPMPSFVGVQAAFVSAKSKNQKEAFDLMKYLSDNTAMPLLKAGNRIPATTSDLDKPEVKNDPIISAFAKQAQNGVPMPNIAEMQTVWKPAGDNLSLITTGKETPDAAAKNVVDQIKQGIATQK